MSTYKIREYITGDTLPGIPSASLIQESYDAGDPGVVYAYRDGNTWDYLPAQDVTRYLGFGHEVQRVWIEES